MVALPARVARPRDKALVEGAVKIIYQRIYVDVRMSEPHSEREGFEPNAPICSISVIYKNSFR